jgi:Acyl-CoA cholesterol acyltransferase
MLSISLSQSTTSISLLYNVLYGYQTYQVVLNPMLRSKSPSDFWSRRWNMVVHKGLKNGAYKPVRKYTNSRVLAVLATFVVSGIIHEYVNLVLFFDRDIQFEWKQILFFSWNGMLILLEYAIGGLPMFQWISKNVPSFLVTAMVVSTALPFAHFFTADWIKGGYFDAVMIAEPLVMCSSSSL